MDINILEENNELRRKLKEAEERLDKKEVEAQGLADKLMHSEAKLSQLQELVTRVEEVQKIRSRGWYKDKPRDWNDALDALLTFDLSGLKGD